VTISAPPEISVVVASHNRRESLAALLDHLTAQKGAGPFEVVVVDDGSEPPVSSDLLAARRPYKVVSHRRPQGGPARARHDGIERASGDVIVILDDDMEVGTDFLAAHRAAHQENGQVILGRIDAPAARPDDRPPIFERFHQRTMDRFRREVASGTATVEGTRLCTGNVSFRRCDYFRVGGFDLDLPRCEDRDLGIKFDRAGITLRYSEAARTIHRSDHRDVRMWRERSALYGKFDTVIASKYPDDRSVSPWTFLSLAPVLARPLLIASALLPRVMYRLGSAAYRIARALDALGSDRAAVSMAGLCYATDYFAGVHSAHAGTRDTWKSFHRFRTRRQDG
jgi:GT2 family glycosyltransferase